MTRAITMGLGLLSALGLAGCGADFDSSETQSVDVSRDALWANWCDADCPPAWGSLTVGMANAPNAFGDKAYAWYNDGWVCRGTRWNVCSDAMYQYSAPGSFSSIRAVGIANNTSHTYAWYSDGTYSQGSSDNLSAHHGKRPFSLPASGGFTMNDLVEVDCSNNGRWYYYWKVGGDTSTAGSLYRTTGTSSDADAYSSVAGPVARATGSPIVGIGFDDSGASRIITWYAGGSVNSSSNSLILYSSEP